MNTIELTNRPGIVFENEGHSNAANLRESARFDEWDIICLIDYIVKQYHTDTRVSIVAIYDLAQKAYSKHSDKHPELGRLVQALFLFFDDLSFHLKQEEQILFPNIIQLSEKKLHEGAFNYGTFGVIKEYALKLEDQHGDVVKQLELFRKLTNNYEPTPDVGVLYRSLLLKMKEFDYQMMQHIKLENNCLFPRAIMMDGN